MSLKALYICLHYYKNIPSDVTSSIVEYVDNKWISYLDVRGIVRWKLNPCAFKCLSEIVSFKPIVIRNFRTIPRIMNANGVEFSQSDTVVVAPKLISPTEIRLSIYAKFEIAQEVFNYAMMSFCWTFGENSDHHRFLKGILYRPHEKLIWNREQIITSAVVDDYAINVHHSEVLFQYIWNPEFNIGEYVIFDTPPPNVWV